MADSYTPSTPSVNNPIVDSQKWNNEYGFIDNFSSPHTNVAGESLKAGLLGLGAGATTGALTNKGTWNTGINTGVGSLLGYLFAHSLGHNAKPEDSSLYDTLGGLAGGGIGMGLSLSGKKKKNYQVAVPGGLHLSAKTSSFKDLLHKAEGQLPSIRLPDSIVGGAVGAGGGAIYNAMKDDGDVSKKTKRHNFWNRLIGGAGIGALAGNVAGDRGRRYLSNTMIPYSYDASNPDVANPIKPTLSKVWNAGILDKPQQPGVADYLKGKYQPPFTENPSIPLHNTTANLAARRELSRLAMGVQSVDKNNIWQKQPDGSFSINPQHANSENLVKEFMYPDPNLKGGLPHHNFLKDPVSNIAKLNNGPGEGDSMMGSIVGGQRIATYPYETTNGQDYLAKIQDNWNVKPRDYETKALTGYLIDKYIKRDPAASIPNIEYTGNSNPEQVSNSIFKRMMMDKLVFKDNPWVSQRMYFQKQPMTNNMDGGFKSIPTTASGQPYPGNTVGKYNQQTDDMDLVGQ